MAHNVSGAHVGQRGVQVRRYVVDRLGGAQFECMHVARSASFFNTIFIPLLYSQQHYIALYLRLH